MVTKGSRRCRDRLALPYLAELRHRSRASPCRRARSAGHVLAFHRVSSTLRHELYPVLFIVAHGCNGAQPCTDTATRGVNHASRPKSTSPCPWAVLELKPNASLVQGLCLCGRRLGLRRPVPCRRRRTARVECSCIVRGLLRTRQVSYRRASCADAAIRRRTSRVGSQG